MLLEKYTSRKADNVLIGLEVTSVLDLLLDPGGMSVGMEIHMISGLMFQ
jgi:hypothetical protein